MIIATLCGMGFGTSMLLKLTIDDVFKEEGIWNHTSRIALPQLS